MRRARGFHYALVFAMLGGEITATRDDEEGGGARGQGAGRVDGEGSRKMRKQELAIDFASNVFLYPIVLCSKTRFCEQCL